jgi:hypothetical protein
MNHDPAGMREPVMDIESAAAKRESASPGRPVLVPMLRADPDLNLSAEPDDREDRPAPAVLPNEPLLNLTPMPAQPAVLPGKSWQPPVLGSLAVIFGIAALFKATLLSGGPGHLALVLGHRRHDLAGGCRRRLFRLRRLVQQLLLTAGRQVLEARSPCLFPPPSV